MDYFDLQQEVKREDDVAETAPVDLENPVETEVEAAVEEPELEIAQDVSPQEMVLDALRDMSKTIRSKTKTLEQIAEKEQALVDLTEELRGMLEGTVEQSDERDDYAVAVERKKTETDLERLRGKADPTAVKQQISDTVTALRAYAETV